MVTDDVAEQFQKINIERGIINSTLVEFLSENNHLIGDAENIEHNDYVINTFEDTSEEQL